MPEKNQYHYANCPIKNGVDLDVAALLDRELQAQHERTAALALHAFHYCKDRESGLMNVTTAPRPTGGPE